jgi:hypothetical protein
MMTRNVSLIVVLAIVYGCAAEQSRVDEYNTTLRIEGGYSSAMLYRLRELIEYESAKAGKIASPPARALATALRQTVWEYNVESANMCAKGLHTELSCLPALDPPWLTESQHTSPTERELQRRSDWLDARVQALWDGACEDFKKSNPSPEDYMGYCSIE